MCLKRIYWSTLALILAAVPLATHAQVENLLQNPSFEEDEVILNDQSYEHWWTWGWENGLNSTVAFDDAKCIDSTRSLRIEPIGSVIWYFIVAYSPIPLEVGTNYTATFWVKAEEPRPLGAKMKATDNSIDWGWTDFELTSEWAEYAFTSEALNAEGKLEFHCASSEVTFWLDFVFVYEGQYVAGIMPGESGDAGKAAHPNPEDSTILDQTWVTLSWTPGASAVSHNVYLGDNFDDVDTGAGDTFRGNQAQTFFTAGFPGFAYPEGLVPGTIYYWRIDEVNEADPNSPWKGDVWSFSIAPMTAYNPDPADGAESVGPDNVTLRWTAGYGAKLNTVYFGDNYDQVSSAASSGAIQSTTSYKAGPLKTEKVYYWRIDEFDGAKTYKGNVWSFSTPGAVGNPKPANGDADVSMTTRLSWTPASNATSHQVYLGLDKDTVRNADTGSPEYKGSAALGSESLDPGKLAWHTTYYWRVDAVYNTGPVKGQIWSFTTADFIVVDDFEGYTDDDAAGKAIWQTWVDGFGIADNGAQVGNLMPPYCERRIVHGGSQSMPLLYINEAGVTNSEASLPLSAARDWTAEGVGQLSLWFRGKPDNAAERLYVAASNSSGAPAIVAYQDANAAKTIAWQQWTIPLQAFADQGINLTNVDKLAIGLGSKGGVGPGGTGTIYIDDIALYHAP